MNLPTLIQETKKLAGEAKLASAFDLLLKHIKPESERYDEFLVIKSSFKYVWKAGLIGIESSENLRTETNKLTNRVLMFTKELEPEDFIEPAEEAERQDFLVFCPADKVADMTEYFTSLNFKGFKVCSYEKPEDISPYQFLVFYNVDIPFCPREAMAAGFEDSLQQLIRKRIDFMNKCLEQKRFSVYFGNTFYWVNEKRDYVHAANSRFALFARVNEMLHIIAMLGK